MFILNFIPDSLLHLVVLSVFFGGVVLYILGLLINFYPPAFPYKEPIKVLATILMISGVYFYGGYGNEIAWRAKAKELQAQIDKAKEESKVENTKITKQIVTKRQVIHERGANVYRYIDREVTKYDNTCTIPSAAIKAHNAAATNSAIDESTK
jgi:hypothetical protein